MAKRILMIENERPVSRLVSLKLQEKGYQVKTSQASQDGLTTAFSKGVELIFIDHNLLDDQTFGQLNQLKKERRIAIVILVDRDGLSSLPKQVESLSDGLLVKPFTVEEVLALVEELLSQRVPQQSHAVSSYRDLILDESNRAVIRRGESIPLTNREYTLLSTLLKNRNTVMGREELLDIVWGQSEGTVETNVVDVYIRYIRGKIDIPGEESYIQTVRSRGYVIKG